MLPGPPGSRQTQPGKHRPPGDYGHVS